MRCAVCALASSPWNLCFAPCAEDGGGGLGFGEGVGTRERVNIQRHLELRTNDVRQAHIYLQLSSFGSSRTFNSRLYFSGRCALVADRRWPAPLHPCSVIPAH